MKNAIWFCYKKVKTSWITVCDSRCFTPKRNHRETRHPSKDIPTQTVGASEAVSINIRKEKNSILEKCYSCRVSLYFSAQKAKI